MGFPQRPHRMKRLQFSLLTLFLDTLVVAVITVARNKSPTAMIDQ